MRVAVLGVVVDVGRMDISFQDFVRLRHVAHDVSMAEIKTYAHVVEVGTLDKLHSLSGVESSLGIFSSRMRTPSGLANARKCSIEVIAASNLRSSNDSPPVPMCCTRKRNGICSATSIARLISSMASIRCARSVAAMFTGGAPVRPQS